MQALFEIVRPRDLAHVVGQPKAVKIAQRVIDAGAGGKAIMLTGPSGSGKTTIGRIIADSVADRYWIEESDASGFDSARLDYIAQACRQYGGGDKGGRAYIVNECHGLNQTQIRKLLVMLEHIPSHVVWIFTTTSDGAEKLFDDQIDAGPLTSRCIQIPLTNQGTAPAFAAFLHDAAKAHGFNGCADAEAVALRIVRKHKGNLRAALQEVEAGAMLAESAGVA